MSYGCGAITDGVHKITIRICNYVPIDIEKGVYVKVIGEIKSVGNGMYNLLCILNYTLYNFFISYF